MKYLLSRLDHLRGVAALANYPLGCVFHTVTVTERRIDLKRTVHEDTAEPRLLGGIDQLGLTDGANHAFGRSGIHRRIGPTGLQILTKRQAVLPLALVCLSIEVEDAVLRRHLSSPL